MTADVLVMQIAGISVAMIFSLFPWRILGPRLLTGINFNPIMNK